MTNGNAPATEAAGSVATQQKEKREPKTGTEPVDNNQAETSKDELSAADRLTDR